MSLEIETIIKRVHQILNENFWPPELKTSALYQRLHDDHDGTGEGKVIVSFLENGDGILTTDKHHGSPLRFRMPFSGGGRSPRVRNALLILAMAIKLDEEENPDS